VSAFRDEAEPHVTDTPARFPERANGGTVFVIKRSGRLSKNKLNDGSDCNRGLFGCYHAQLLQEGGSCSNRQRGRKKKNGHGDVVAPQSVRLKTAHPAGHVSRKRAVLKEPLKEGGEKK